MKPKSNKRITILCQHFYPEEASTGQQVTELAQDLSQAGYEVSVISSQPTYFIKHKNKLSSRGQYEKIKISRTNNTRFNKDNIAGRLINALTYFLSAAWILFKQPGEEILLVYTNPPFLPVLAFLSRLLRRQRYIVVIYDLYPDTVCNISYLCWLKLFSGLFNFLNRIVFNAAEKVIVIGKDMQRLLESRRIKPEKITYIPNWADGEVIKPLAKSVNFLSEQYQLRSKFVVGYSGTLARYHDFETVVLAAGLLKDEPIVFLFICSGAIVGKLKIKVEQKGLTNFVFLPYQDKKMLSLTIPLADAGLVLQRPEYKGVNVPSKTYAYLAAGLALVGVLPEGSEIAGLIKESGCGFTVQPGEPMLLADKIKTLFRNQKLREEMSRRSRKIFEQNYERKVITEQYRKVFDQVLALT